jgi:hypothetical protein
MFGCIGRLVVLAILIVAGAIAYLTRGMWEPKLRETLGAKPAAVAEAPKWEPVTAAGAARAKAALETFKRASGPVFVNVSAGDLIAYAVEPALKVLSAAPPVGSSARGATVDSARKPYAEALAGENEVTVRGNVNMTALGGSAVLGPMAGALGGTQEIEVRGQPSVTAPGKGLLRVTRIKVGNLVLPSALIGRVVQRIAPKKDPALADDVLVLAIPAEVADVRVSNGRVTLYKAVK